MAEKKGPHPCNLQFRACFCFLMERVGKKGSQLGLSSLCLGLDGCSGVNSLTMINSAQAQKGGCTRHTYRPCIVGVGQPRAESCQLSAVSHPRQFPAKHTCKGSLWSRSWNKLNVGLMSFWFGDHLHRLVTWIENFKCLRGWSRTDTLSVVGWKNKVLKGLLGSGKFQHCWKCVCLFEAT